MSNALRFLNVFQGDFMTRLAVFFLAISISGSSAFAATDAMSRMDMNGMEKKSATDATADGHHGTGVVKSVDSNKGVVTIAHEPIKTLGWPAMTMGFKTKDPKVLAHAKPGERVRFTLVQAGKNYVITALE